VIHALILFLAVKLIRQILAMVTQISLILMGQILSRPGLIRPRICKAGTLFGLA
jgi:hypothetical protein